MPNRPMRPCTSPSCPMTAMPGSAMCEGHQRERQSSYDRARKGTENRRMYGYRWNKYSKWFLQQHPLCCCTECASRTVPLPADVTDHITPHRGDPVLFWSPDNHQAMNHSCHSRKTVKHDGGFGKNSYKSQQSTLRP